ncbi:MAG: LytTR family DNA-binding domain-containing protein [Bacteroidales bacterium]|jgi:two-component system LytT family response regulator|nr:LytTR family DNA-binding domain-containing protein [Bacteroidales bacterium]
MLKTVVIDDELNGRNIVKSFLEKYCDGVNVIGEADGVESGVECIIENNPDLVFLDIQMQDGTGFDLLEKLPKRNFKLVFVTSFDHYAIKAFKFSAVDYILKPVDPDQLVEAVEKVKAMAPADNVESKIDVLISNINSLEKIALPSMDGIRFVKINEIIRCESDNNYTLFYLTSKEKILVSKTLKDFEILLSGSKFYRVHKSHLVNLKFISKYIPGEGGYLILEDGSHVDVSRRKKEGLMQILMG